LDRAKTIYFKEITARISDSLDDIDIEVLLSSYFEYDDVCAIR